MAKATNGAGRHAGSGAKAPLGALLCAPIAALRAADEPPIPAEAFCRNADISAAALPTWSLNGSSTPTKVQGWQNEADRIDFARRMEAFLAKYLK